MLHCTSLSRRVCSLPLHPLPLQVPALLLQKAYPSPRTRLRPRIAPPQSPNSTLPLSPSVTYSHGFTETHTHARTHAHRLAHKTCTRTRARRHTDNTRICAHACAYRQRYTQIAGPPVLNSAGHDTTCSTNCRGESPTGTHGPGCLQGSPPVAGVTHTGTHSPGCMQGSPPVAGDGREGRFWGQALHS